MAAAYPDPASPPADHLSVALDSVEASARRLLNDIASARHASALCEAFALVDRLGDLRSAVAETRGRPWRAGGRP